MAVGLLHFKKSAFDCQQQQSRGVKHVWEKKTLDAGRAREVRSWVKKKSLGNRMDDDPENNTGALQQQRRHGPGNGISPFH
jgi:hypothetical protein